MITQATANKIKEAVTILDVMKGRVTLKPGNKEWKGCCPFHGDRHIGSFMVNPEKNIATCFPCGKTWDPIGFIMEYEGLDFLDALRLIAQEKGIPIEDGKVIEPIEYFKKPEPVELELRTFPIDIVARYRANYTPTSNDNFVRWLYSINWSAEQRARIQKVLMNYGVGHSSFVEFSKQHDFTIFWEVDEEATLHNGHFMKYKDDGHRVKDNNEYPTTWLHARMQYARKNPFDRKREKESYCLFGQHLMAAYPNAVVNIVESEKTAIVMSIAYGYPEWQIWMACCGLGNLTGGRQLLKPLIEANRRIVLYPDHDGVTKWTDEAKTFNYKRLSVNDEPVTKWWRERDGDKADIADVVIRMLGEKSICERNNPKPKNQIQDWVERYPAFETLNNNFKLEPI